MDDLAVLVLGPVERLRRILSEIRGHSGQDDINGTFPAASVTLLARIGLLRAFASPALGGELFDSAADYVDMLFDSLRLIGCASLSLGRLFEGHVNAILLIDRYGSGLQRRWLLEQLSKNSLFGVWNTESQPGVHLVRDRPWRLEGLKSYASGAGSLDHAVITARLPEGGKQMLIVPLSEQRERADPASWRVSGMRATVSGTHDFSGLATDEGAFLGKPGDYETEPMFTAGAWRFTAVQLGGIEALVSLLREHLRVGTSASDPIHRARFANAVAMERTAFLWVREAARRTELLRSSNAVPFVLMTRGVVEDAALAVIEVVQRSVGTRAFFLGNPIDRIMRDLQLYLRQPVPDQARDRAATAWLDADCWDEDRWW